MAAWLVVSVLACCAWTVMAVSKAEVRRDSITTPHMDILMKGAHPSQVNLLAVMTQGLSRSWPNGVVLELRKKVSKLEKKTLYSLFCAECL